VGPAHTLLVLRHAKAAGEPGVNDLHRPLTGRGRRDAQVAGRWLLAQRVIPDRVVCSSAERARETWAGLSAELGAAGPGPGAVTFDRRAYDADIDWDILADPEGNEFCVFAPKP
jgi:phosphohistidine phosphatase